MLLRALYLLPVGLSARVDPCLIFRHDRGVTLTVRQVEAQINFRAPEILEIVFANPAAIN